MKRSYYLPRSHNLSLVRYMGADASSEPEEAHITCDKLIGAFPTAKMHTEDSNQGEHSKATASQQAQSSRQPLPQPQPSLSEPHHTTPVNTVPRSAAPIRSSSTGAPETLNLSPLHSLWRSGNPHRGVRLEPDGNKQALRPQNYTVVLLADEIRANNCSVNKRNFFS